MMTNEMKRDWLSTAKNMGMRFIVVVSSNKEDDCDHVSYCADEARMLACLQRIRASRRQGRQPHWATSVLDVQADWPSQINAERAWAPAVPARLRKP